MKLRFIKNTKKSYQRKKTSLENISVAKLFRTGMYVIAAVGVFVYLLQVNDTATKGYEIQALEERVEVLEEENSNLEIYAARLQSLKRVQKVVRHENMVRGGEHIMYADAGNNAVAVNQ